MTTLSVLDAAREVPESPAVIIGDAVFTFGALAEMVRRRASELLDDVARDTPFVLVGTATLQTLVSLYALFELGRPALLLHPRWTESERAALLDHAHGAPSPQCPLTDERPLAILYTSGTTGTPRGIVLSRRAFLASAHASAQNLGWTAADRWLLALPLAHVGGLSVVTRCLFARRPVVIPAALARNERVALEDLIDCIESSRVTLLSLVPTQLAWLLDRAPAWNPPPHVRAILLGGAPASARRLSETVDRHWPVLTTYGMTETCSQVSTLPFGAKNRGALGAGLPTDGTEVRIVDGVIEVRGPSLFSGYYPHTPERPPIGPSRWFKTHDHGFFDDAGCLHVLGRGSDLIVTGGENVHPLEVETVLERYAGVRAACVFGVDDETWGQIVAAALVVEPSTFDEASFAGALRSTLAPFKRPRRYALVDSLVLGPTGKIDRAATANKAGNALVAITSI